MKKKFLIIGSCALFAASAALSQQKPDDNIRARQAAFTLVATHVGRIKANLDGDYKKDEVVKSATLIQSIANAGLRPYFKDGTDKGVGFHDTQVKPDWFNPDNDKKVTEAINNFKEQADQLALITTIGDKAAVQAQFGKLRATCKGCHDNFRFDSTSAK